MIRRTHRRHWLDRYESLENRLALAVTATLTDEGALVVAGDAEAAVEIRALDAETFEITEGANVQTVTGVTGPLHIRLTDVQLEPPANPDDPAPEVPAGANDDTVTIDLGGQSVDGIFAALGNGDNSLSISNGILERGLGYRGGAGADVVNLNADLAISRGFVLGLGGGDNTANIDADTQGRASVMALDGNDTVNIGAGAALAQSLQVRLGNGNNAVHHLGMVGVLQVGAGRGDDTVSVGAGATIGRALMVDLGPGANSLTVDGDVQGDLFYGGREGNDTVTISSTGHVGHNAAILLGGGANSVSVTGHIDGNLLVLSQNADDTADIAEGAVGGRSFIHLGGGLPIPGGPGQGGPGPGGHGGPGRGGPGPTGSGRPRPRG